MRPRPFPDSTSETVDCDTPARRATSTLVTRDGALISAILGRVDDLVEEVVAIAGHDLCLLRPRDAEALLDEEAFDHEEFLPYWAELWPSALALARAIGTRALHGARTLELGCGLGLPSLAAALAGGRVLATDWAPDAVAMTARNAERNGIALETLACSWSAPAPLLERGPWDIVLASDVL
jgi:2-polyprenyl-3-methyl-5-hydroxy-6-metoxy-1,4-benzoquinol methylase